jgi:hypothetical protein
MVIFQAIEVPEAGKEADPYYAMYVARLEGGTFTTIEKVSPPGSANTCGWFHPTDPNFVLFGSTMTTPKEEVASGYQRGTSRYRWAFPSEMDVVVARLAERDQTEGSPFIEAKPLFTRPNYDAECTFDASGRFVLYAHIEDAPKPAVDAPKDTPPPKPDANIYIHDTKTEKDIPIVVAPGYDGGPFFSPDGQWICYRSDRRGNDELQLFVAKLAFEKDADGTPVPTGLSHEFQVTDNAHVNWCPFFHPAGDFLVYATSEVGHQNYEVFAVEIPKTKLTAVATDPAQIRVNVPGLRRVRITHADGADVLPAFNADGSKMIWCSQRGPKIEGEPRPSSQVWIADWTGTPFKD